MEELYSTCSNPADHKTIFLVIKNEETDESPGQITIHEDFKNRPFDELWEWATTPRFSKIAGQTVWLIRRNNQAQAQEDCHICNQLFNSAEDLDKHHLVKYTS